MELQNELNELASTLATLLKAIPQSDQDIWKRKINNAQSEQRMISQSLKEICRRRDKEKEDEESKKSLLDRRYDLDNVKLDNEYKMNAAASNSVNMVSQYIQMGKNTIAAFREQRELMESMQSKLVDAGHTMGLSSSMMSVIQRRDFVDRLIVFGGMFVVTIVVILIWWWKS